MRKVYRVFGQADIFKVFSDRPKPLFPGTEIPGAIIPGWSDKLKKLRPKIAKIAGMSEDECGLNEWNIHQLQKATKLQGADIYG